MADREAGVASSVERGAPATPSPGASAGDIVNRRTGRWRLRNWRLRSKVLAVLILPTLTALVLAGLRAQSELRSQEQFQLTVTQLTTANKASAVVNELEKERLIAVEQVAGDKVSGQTLIEQTKLVDGAIGELRAANNELTKKDAGLGHSYGQSLQRLDSLDAVRETVGSGSSFPPEAVYDTYTAILSNLVQLGREVNAAVTDRGLLRQSSTVQSLSEAKEYASEEDALMQIAAGADKFPTGLVDETRSAQASFTGALNDFNANTTLDEQQFYSDTVSGPEIDDRERIRDTAFTRDEEGVPLDLNSSVIADNSQANSERLRTVQTNLQDKLLDQASVLADDARDSAIRDGILVLAALLAALLLVVLVVRSLLKPLRVLRTSALDVAYRRLPDEVEKILADPNPMEASKNAVQPVPVFTAEETGQVARSFDEVHTRAVQLAAEQALLRDNVNAMLVNLSRRSQALVERQLGLIDRLEADEQDPDQLANLFELDHLATRMRRNSENLLVLSGTELGRRLNKPVPLSDVIGAAVSETDQYARVDVRPAPQAALAGPAVNDVVHLIAELLDNATAYSSPETQVTVRSATGRKGTLAVEVIDRGVGVDEAELARLNERLANPPDLDVSVSRRMGLYVVATLARRHAIQVQLRENLEIEGGVVAKVVLAAALVTELPGAPAVESSAERSVPRTPPAPEQTGTGYFPASTGSGTFPVIGADEQGMGSPAMASNGILGAFDATASANGNGTLSRNGNGDAPAAPATETAYQEPVQPPAPPRPQPAEPTGFVQQAPPAEPPAEQDDPAAAGRAMSLNNGANARSADADVPTDRLPIYEEVLSQWFSTAPAAEPQPDVAAEPMAAEPLAAEPVATEPAAPDVPDVPADESGASPLSVSGLPKRVPGSKNSELPKRATPSTPAPQQTPAQAASPAAPAMTGANGADEEWSSPADNGWQAAKALLQPVDEMTAAGLPKRRPKAHLVPGSAAMSPSPSAASAGSGPATAVAAPSMVPRSADAVRGRMSSLQKGVARGRHALIEANHDGAPNSDDDVNSSHRERQ